VSESDESVLDIIVQPTEAAAGVRNYYIKNTLPAAAAPRCTAGMPVTMFIHEGECCDDQCADVYEKLMRDKPITTPLAPPRQQYSALVAIDDSAINIKHKPWLATGIVEESTESFL